MTQIDKAPWQGILPATATPFNDKNQVNEAAMLALMERNLKEGAAGFFIGGSSAECFLLSHEERIRTFEIAAEMRGKAKLAAHVGALGTDEAIDFAHAAKRLGFDLISATAPFYYKHSMDAVAQYYMDIFQAVEIPILIYNFPGNTGVDFDLSHPAIQKLLTSGAIAGVKHTNRDLYQLERFRDRNPDLLLFCGFDEILSGAEAMGCDGAIGSTFNFMLPHYLKLWDACKKQDRDSVLSLQHSANIIMETIVSIGLIPSIKAILKMQGIDVGLPRRPFRPISKEQEEQIARVLEQYLVQ